MSTGAPVNIQVRFGKDAMDIIKQLTEEAIQRAIQNTIMDIAEYAYSPGSQVPVRTGRLLASLDISSTPRSIVFGWSAIDPISNFDYAKIQDEGGLTGTGGWILPKYFSQVTKNYAKERLLYHLNVELQSLNLWGI